MKITNKLGLPQPFVDAVKNDSYDPGAKTWRSTTSLIGPAQKAALTERHYEKLEDEASDRVWALFGQVVHNILERANTEGLPEERYYMDILGKCISGQTDNLVFLPCEGGWELQDYKTGSVWKYKKRDFQEWEYQVNVYKLLLEEAGFNITKLTVIAMWRDWRYGENASNKVPGGYPEQQITRHSISIWPRELIMDYLEGRVEAHKKAVELPDDKLPPCTDDECWAKNLDRPFAVKKPNGKRALKLFATMDEAASFSLNSKHDDLEIEERKPEFIRCERYCNVAPFCHQFKQLNNGDNQDERRTTDNRNELTSAAEPRAGS